MSTETDAVVRTRQTASEVIAKSLEDLEGVSETELTDRIFAEIALHSELFPDGWYDPPPRGVAVLFGDSQHKRTQFETLREPTFWPKSEFKFGPESIGMVYASPVDRETGMFGDIGFSIYRGANEETKKHLKDCYQIVQAVAEHAALGMRFCDLYAYAQGVFHDKVHKKIGWMTTAHDPLKINLGHTAPGSYGDVTPLGASFDEIKEAIRSRRVYINEVEQFIIPETCAFTVEARLVDASETQPNVFFHVIVVFSEGRKNILTNFDTIFKTVGMEYML